MQGAKDEKMQWKMDSGIMDSGIMVLFINTEADSKFNSNILNENLNADCLDLF